VSNSVLEAVRGDTKGSLILSGLELFATQGLDAVSMRTINAHAGARNASAVHYHFGSKMGMVKAIVEFLKGQLDGHRLPIVNNLEARAAAGEQLTVREILGANYWPYIRLYEDPKLGRHGVLFLARLHTDIDTETQALLNQDTHGIPARLDALLAQVLPGLGAQERRTRYIYSWSLTLHGLAAGGNWKNTSLGDLRTGGAQASYERLLDYLVGGMTAPGSSEA
jgi:AcrR family transcriptional regulator